MTEWLNGIVGEAIAPYAAIGIALVIVFVLMMILFRIIRFFRSGKFGTAPRSRLGVMEYTAVDQKRKLVLVRRDNIEHLILIGGPADLVVETGINQNHPARQTQTTQPVVNPDMATEAKTAPPPVSTPQPVASSSNTPVEARPVQLTRAPQAAPATYTTPQTGSPGPSAQLNPSRTTETPQTKDDSAKVKNDMNRLLDQIAGD